MKTKAIVDILCNQGGCTHKDGIISVSESNEVSLYANLGSETLNLRGILKIEFADDLVIVTTRKEAIFAILQEDIRVVSIGKNAEKRRPGLI